MKTELRLRPHLIKQGQVIEVWCDGKFIATVSASAHVSKAAIHIISKYPMDASNVDAVEFPHVTRVTFDS